MVVPNEGPECTTEFVTQGYTPFAEDIKMKKALFLFLLTFFFSLTAPFGQESEIYLKFNVDSRQELEALTKMISIDNVTDGTVYAYASEKDLDKLRESGYEYTVLPHPGTLIDPEMASATSDMREWDSYPMYEAYVAMMNQFAVDYPSLCVVVNIGSSVQGRDLLFAKISDNVNTEENEPEVMYTSTMHGDETTGYVLMLRLIDYFLTNYGVDSLATRLVDSCEIWINPLANPDGTYAAGNHTVNGATRRNANFVDLNRNFPDPEDGDHPDGNAWQPETIAMMNLADNHSFVISANHHGGAEVVNYPWDTWATLHADDQWYIDVSRAYADSAQYYSPSGYLTDLNNGITNGYAWYTISGGRQDYMNWWHSCREVTIEISSTKLLPPSQLPAYWGYNKASFLNWLENALYGIRGIVTDSVSRMPMYARVTIVGHDFDSSEVYTDPDVGDYHRMIEAGTYDVEFTAPGYLPHTEYSVVVTDNNATVIDIALLPLPDEPVLTLVGHTAGEAGPGDTVTTGVSLKNIGGADAVNVSATLTTADAYITVTQPVSSYPTLFAEGGTGTSDVDYEFIISEVSPNLRDVIFNLEITADGGFYDTLSFNYFVGERVEIFFDNFALNLGWSGLGGSGEWMIDSASGGYGSDSYGGPDPSLDHSPGSDNNVMGNDLNPGSGGDYSSSLGTTYWVTSPYIDCSSFFGVQMIFYRWLGVESNTYDHAYLEAYDGATWVTIFENGSVSIDESSWIESFFDVSVYADSNPDFRIRFGLGPTDGSANFCGWNIDDVSIKGYGEAPSGSPEIAYSPSSISDSLQIGESSDDTIRVYNNGEALLRVRFSSSDSWLDFNQDQHNVAPDDSLILPVTVSTEGLTPGDNNGLIEFTSNDPVTPNGTIPVSLHIYPPDIYLPQASIEETITSGKQSSRLLVVGNNGPGRLDYEISSMMFNAKQYESETVSTFDMKVLGYRTADSEKSGIEEPFYAPVIRGSGGPDNWGYSWVDSDNPSGPVYDWVDISSVGTEIAELGDDDTSSAIPIGFVFPFYENSYLNLYIGSNGILTFDSGSTSRTNVNIPNVNAPNSMIAMWWDDLDPRKGGHIYYYADTASNRFIISFVEIPNYYSTTGTGALTFQAILHPDGKVLLQYSLMDPGADYDGLTGSTVGIENSAGDDGLEVVYNAEYIHDDLAILFNAASWLSVEPAAGSVEPFSSDTVQVNFDAAELEEGIYDGQLTVTSNDPDTPTLDVPVTLTVEPAFICGDTDSSGAVNILDVTRLIDYLYKGGAAPDPIESGDVNNSGSINLLDVTRLINYLYKDGPPPQCP